MEIENCSYPYCENDETHDNLILASKEEMTSVPSSNYTLNVLNMSQ